MQRILFTIYFFSDWKTCLSPVFVGGLPLRMLSMLILIILNVQKLCMCLSLFQNRYLVHFLVVRLLLIKSRQDPWSSKAFLRAAWSLWSSAGKLIRVGLRVRQSKLSLTLEDALHVLFCGTSGSDTK